MQATGDPTTLAPEICIEVMSDSNDWEEMQKKRHLYVEAGAEEVWVVTEEKKVRFFADEEIDASGLAPDFPNQL
jgi:Uma2 family endonuclease